MNPRIFQHPIAILLAIGAVAAMGVGAIDALYLTADSRTLIELPNGDVIEKGATVDWAKVIANCIWTGLIGGGLVWLTLRVTTWYRLNQSSDEHAHLIHNISRDECTALDDWVKRGYSQFKT